MTNRIESLLAQLTDDEKIALLGGADAWHTVAIPRLGIPAIKVTDGPNGARGASRTGVPTSACFPVGVALGATWNPDLVREVGEALAAEVQAKGAHILLAPTVNIHRSPLAGRNFECYSEDPFLTGTLASAYIDGLQSRGVGACIKHFVCNDSEFERHSISSDVGERALREIYLKPFEMAMQRAKPWSLMSAYNRINGVWASENDRLLLDILKGEWGFDGLVMSDWYGTYTPRAIAGGLDLEMPGPPKWLQPEQVRAALAAGEVSAAQIDDKVRRLLRTIERVGAFAQPALQPEQAIDRPEHRALIRRAGAEAIVLLKNEGDLLPLHPDRPQSIAVIGANAKWASIMGGGSAQVAAHYILSPLEGIRNRAGDGVQIEYAVGCHLHRLLPNIDKTWLRQPGSEAPGVLLTYFSGPDLAAEPRHVEVIETMEASWFGNFVEGVNARQFSARLSTDLTAPESRRYLLGLNSVGQARLWLDGDLLIDQWTDKNPLDGSEKQIEVTLQAGRRYRLEIAYRWAAEGNWRGLHLGLLPAAEVDLLVEAEMLAARADVVLLFAGLTAEWEGEGTDRVNMDLPGRQDELIRRVAAANRHTVVVLNNGSPLHMPWIDDVAAVMQAWYGGQEAGNAIADVLFGVADPGGRLPTTFPKRLADNPAYLNYPGENGHVLYGEGLFVGYRYYDAKGIEPLFPFGHGLSYTRFEYANLQLAAAELEPGQPLSLSLDVTNVGQRPGAEVVQVYVRDIASRLQRPAKELKAFAKVHLQPGETRTLTLTLAADAFAYYDPARPGWVTEAGAFEVSIGKSAADLRLSRRIWLL